MGFKSKSGTYIEYFLRGEKLPTESPKCHIIVDSVENQPKNLKIRKVCRYHHTSNYGYILNVLLQK